MTRGMTDKHSGDESSRVAAAARKKTIFDDVLRGVRMRSSVYFRPELQAPWGIEMARDCAIFHIVDHGACWLQVNGTESAVHLSEGDFVVVTRGQRHTLRDEMTTPAVNFFELVQQQPRVGAELFASAETGLLRNLYAAGWYSRTATATRSLPFCRRCSTSGAPRKA